MESLKERIVNNGSALNETVLKVDSFLNHQVDAKLMYEMGTYFKEYFKNHGITRILTIESSGIAPTIKNIKWRSLSDNSTFIYKSYGL